MAGYTLTSKSVPTGIVKFNGGLNSNASGLNLADNESPSLQNIDFDVSGSIVKRNGYTPINSTPISYGGNDDYTVLLLNGNGADASDTFDDSAHGATVEHDGSKDGTDTQVDVDYSIFGGASILLDGVNDRLVCAAHADFYFGTGDFTIDFWVRFKAIDAAQVLCSSYKDADEYWKFHITAANKLGISFYDVADKGTYIMTSAWSGLAINTWYHLEVCRSTTSCKIFINGTSQTLTETTAIAANDVGDTGVELQIGSMNDGTVFGGWIDEFRISKGIARHTANFTVSNTPYNTDTSSTAIQGLKWFEMSSGTDYLVCKSGTEVYKMDSLDGTWDNITGSVTLTDVDTDLVSFDIFSDYLMMTDGTAIPWYWDGGTTTNCASMTLPTNLTKSKFICVYNGYTILANVYVNGTWYKSRIYWSNLDSISTWTDSDYRDINKGDGQDITGIKVLGDKLVVFKDRSIWVGLFTGDSDIPFVFQRTPSDVGCDSGHSIQEVKNGLLFHSYDGFYYFDGSNSTKLSERIDKTLETFATGQFPYITSAYQRSKNRYWSSFALSGATSKSKCITWDSGANAFSYYTGHNPVCFATVYTSGSERIYFGDYSGYVYRADYGTNDYPLNVSTEIDAYYTTKWYNFDDLIDEKGIPTVTIFYQASNSTMTFSYSYDFQDGDTYQHIFDMSTSGAVYDTAVYDTDVYATVGGNIERRDLTGRGRVVRFKFANNRDDETMRVDGLGIVAYLESAK